MKSLKIISIIVIMIFAGNSMFASKVNNSDEKRIKNKIGQYMEVPNFVKENNMIGTVLVEVSIENDGQLKVNEINGHPNLTNYVTNQLEKISIRQSKGLYGKSFLYKIIFK